jgi:hypothetical protein
MSSLYAIADIHGHRDEMNRALRAEGLVDEGGNWSGGDARLWFLGDYVDRGPDGIGVIDDIRRLTAQASEAGGEVGALIGNHEAKILAVWLFGDAPVPGRDEPSGFHGQWKRYGGREHDLRRLTVDHVEWIKGLTAVALVNGYLLLHSDTGRYLELGSTIEQINHAVARALQQDGVQSWLELYSLMRSRGGFRGAEPARADDAVATMLDTLGGKTIVHGHTQLSKFGFATSDITVAHRYADGRVLAIDGGVFEDGGRVLLTKLA